MSHQILSIINKPASALIFAAILGVLLLSACDDSRELSRERAEKLIAESSELRQPAVLSLTNPLESDPFGLDKTNDSEKVENAKTRNLERFLDYYPAIAAAHHLGLASIEQQLLREEKAVGRQVPAQWFFTVQVRTGEQGKLLWKEFDASASDAALPLARREMLGITGITSAGENQMQADFTWHWKPNRLALALQENTEEFKALPAKIQAGLRGQTEANRKPLTENWSGERRGKALFRRYDDGWRLSGMTVN